MATHNLTTTVARGADISEDQAANLVSQVFEAVATRLLIDGQVYVDGFGTFKLKVRKARRARNPRTGDRIDVPAKVIVQFNPTPNLRDQISQIPPEQVEK
jgi:integration host factor subunit beta